MENPQNLKYYFFYLSTSIIIVSGLKMASEIVVILFLAIFIASLFSALLSFLQNFKIPKIIAYFLIILVFVIIIMLITYMINSSLNSFSSNLPLYEQKIKILISGLIDYMGDEISVKVNKDELLKVVDMSYFFNFSTKLLGGIGTFFSKFLLVFIGVAFIISESKSFEKKLRIIFKNDKKKLKSFKLFSYNLQRYFIVKTFTSFLTGFFVYILLIFFDLNYPLLWAVLAFLFNFIPVVGSVIASIPAILLSLISTDLNITFWLIISYVVVNISISNIIEPKLMGKELGLSPMVIFFSLIFWGWILGIVGMFLAVPITMTLKIAFESTQNTKWVGILLSNLSTKR